MMQGKTMVLILGAVAFSATGQLFLKSGAQHLAGLGRLEFLLAAARDVRVLVGDRRLGRVDGVLALRSPRRPVVEGLPAVQPHLRARPAGERLRLRRTASSPARRGHGSDHHRCRLLALRGLSGRAGAGGACLLRSCAWLWGGCSGPGGTRRLGSSTRTASFRCESHRLFYAPLLVWLGGPLVRLLDTGVRVLPQREWEERERQLYRSLHGTVDSDRRRRDARPASPRGKDAGDAAGGSGARGVGPEEGHRTGGRRPRRVPSPGDLPTATPWPRT